jgi:histidyl-tRNA synthetase
LKEHGVAPKQASRLDGFLIPVGVDDYPTVLKLAHELRDAGLAVEYSLKPQAVRKQLELAAARAAPRAVIIGPDERKAGTAVVRDLGGGAERAVPIATVLTELKRS